MVSLKWGNFALQVTDQMITTWLLGICAVAFVILVIAAISVSRCDKPDIAKVIEAFGLWWPWRRK